MPSLAVAQSPAAESSVMTASDAGSSALLTWSVDQVGAMAVEHDPVRRALLHERDLARRPMSSKHSNSTTCSLTPWITRHVDERIKRREAEVQTQVWKLHFGLVQIQAQSLVLSDLQIIADSFDRMVNGLTREGAGNNELLQELEELNRKLVDQEDQLEFELSRLRIQLQGLLGTDDAKEYWPKENLTVRFRRVDLAEQVALAQAQRSDVSIWASTPRGAATITDLQALEGMLSASWVVIPTAVPSPTPLKLLAKKHTEAELRRLWSKRLQQMEELAEAKKIEMETEVRLKAADLNRSYALAEAKQKYLHTLDERLQQQRVLVEQGMKSRHELLISEIEYQQQRSEWFRMLGNARQAEIDLALATADNERWLKESSHQGFEVENPMGAEASPDPNSQLEE
jgi:hypothetical protein